jgi:hypothetical protein
VPNAGLIKGDNVQYNLLGHTAASVGCSTVHGQVYRGSTRGIQSHQNPDDGDRDSFRNVGLSCNQLTRLCAREHFIVFSRRESFKLYGDNVVCETHNNTEKVQSGLHVKRKSMSYQVQPTKTLIFAQV